MYKRIHIYIYNQASKNKYLLRFIIVFIIIMIFNQIGVYNYFSDTLIISKPQHDTTNPINHGIINDIHQSISLRGGNNDNNDSIFKINNKDKTDIDKEIKTNNFFDFELKLMLGGGQHVKLNKFYRRRSCYLVILAPLSCGRSERVYLELVNLYDQYATGGLEIMAFLPAYGHFKQETRDAVSNWGARFPMYSTQHAHKFLKYLYSFTVTQPDFINDCLFDKFLLDANGDVLSFHGTSVMPSSLSYMIIDLIRGYNGKIGDF